MRSPVVLVVISVAVIIVGGALLKGFGDQGSSDPTASVRNGAPRGVLALHLLLASTRSIAPLAAPGAPSATIRDASARDTTATGARSEGERIDVVTSFNAPPLIADGDALLVMPPERAGWIATEAEAIIAAAHRGARVLIACDDEEERNARLKSLLDAVGVECFRADVAIGDESVTRATSALSSEVLFVRGTGRVRTKGSAPAFAAWTAGADAVVVKRPVGAGVITVIGSATVLANDGLSRDGNAAFALRELAGDRVVIDERHHHSRSRAAVLTAAAKGTGPITALLALLLLVPLSLLSLVPRPGDAPRAGEDAHGAPAAEASAKALAALLVHARRSEPPRD